MRSQLPERAFFMHGVSAWRPLGKHVRVTAQRVRVVDGSPPSTEEPEGSEPGPSRRPRPSLDALKQAIGWAAGIPFASTRYLSRDVEIRREESTRGWPLPDFPKGEPDRLGDHAGVKLPAHGVGDAYRRRYKVCVDDPLVSAEDLMAIMQNDPGVACPLEIARFEKTKGQPGQLDRGDEFRIRLPGPWNGPVRVIEVTPCSFRLATLEGHMEAGEIEFRASEQPDGQLQFEIESWARSASRAFALLYDGFGWSRELQLHMWAQFLERAAQISGGTVSDAIEATTERCDRHPF